LVFSLVFDCAHGEQYESIGNFWDFMRKTFTTCKLEGLGFNWKDDTLEYVIGSSKDLQIETVLKEKIFYVTKQYPKALIKSIDIPNNNWKKYSDRTERLGKLYADIYKDGVLDYEIETFFDDGTCSVEIHRSNYSIRKVTINDYDELIIG